MTRILDDPEEATDIVVDFVNKVSKMYHSIVIHKTRNENYTFIHNITTIHSDYIQNNTRHLLRFDASYNTEVSPLNPELRPE